MVHIGCNNKWRQQNKIRLENVRKRDIFIAMIVFNISPHSTVNPAFWSTPTNFHKKERYREYEIRYSEAHMIIFLAFVSC